MGASNCIGGARLQFRAGRSNFSLPAPDLTVPEPSDSADKIFARMGDAGFTPLEVAALLASHSTAAQDKVDTTIPVCEFSYFPALCVDEISRELPSTPLSVTLTRNSSSK